MFKSTGPSLWISWGRGGGGGGGGGGGCVCLPFSLSSIIYLWLFSLSFFFDETDSEQPKSIGKSIPAYGFKKSQEKNPGTKSLKTFAKC